MKRTNPETENHVLSLIMLGYPYPDIAEKTGVAVSTVKKIKARNKQAYEAGKRELVQFTADAARVSLQRVYTLLNKHLDERGDTMSIDELLAIADQMHVHQQAARVGNETEPLYKKQKDLEKLLSGLEQ